MRSRREQLRSPVLLNRTKIAAGRGEFELESRALDNRPPPRAARRLISDRFIARATGERISYNRSIAANASNDYPLNDPISRRVVRKKIARGGEGEKREGSREFTNREETGLNQRDIWRYR